MTVAGVSSPAHAGLVNRLGLWILAMLLLSPAVYLTGVKTPSALCEPSQKGWLRLFPHEHHQ